MNVPQTTIRLNGEPLVLEGAPTLVALIAQRRPTPPFAVEVNKRLVRRGDYASTALRENDEVEIVTLVGGG